MLSAPLKQAVGSPALIGHSADVMIKFIVESTVIDSSKADGFIVIPLDLSSC